MIFCLKTFLTVCLSVGTLTLISQGSNLTTAQSEQVTLKKFPSNGPHLNGLHLNGPHLNGLHLNTSAWNEDHPQPSMDEDPDWIDLTNTQAMLSHQVADDIVLQNGQLILMFSE